MDPIDPNKSIPAIITPQTANDQSKPGAPSFHTVFKESLDASNVQPSAPESLTLASGIHPAQFRDEPQSSAKTVVDQIKQLVDTMAAYQDKLAQKGATLKEVDPLVQQMATQSKALAAISETAGGQDAKLKEMIDQSLMLSTLEISRYRNGYYI